MARQSRPINGNYTHDAGRKGQSREKTIPVSEIEDAVNEWGLRHMHGNVLEWCEDWWHDTYAQAPQNGDPWLNVRGGNQARRVVRGGSWLNSPQNLRVASRVRNGPEIRSYVIGFRLKPCQTARSSASDRTRSRGVTLVARPTRATGFSCTPNRRGWSLAGSRSAFRAAVKVAER